MSNSSLQTYSIHGRELGIQRISSAQMGSSNPAGFLTGAEDIRQRVVADSTSVVAPPFGLSIATTGSSAVHNVGAPIPGIVKHLYSSGGATAYFNMNGATIASSVGTTQATVRFAGAGLVSLMGITTALWAVVGQLTTAGGLSLAAST